MGVFWKGLEMWHTEAIERYKQNLMGDSDQSLEDQNADRNMGSKG